jgi:hypothetical protein
MTTGNHDTLVYRLAQILVKLNQGEKLDPVTLADEFGVNLRTIQRDLNVRFAYYGIDYISQTPAFRPRQLHDETKSCGTQPANIRVNNRRESGRIPVYILEA